MVILRHAAIAAVLVCALASCDKAQQQSSSEFEQRQAAEKLASGDQSAQPTMGAGTGTNELALQNAPAAETAAPAAPMDVNTLTQRANQGDRIAQYELGVRYAQGSGVAKNPFTAVELFTLAAEQGEPRAQFELGSAFLTGEGARPSIQSAFDWYSKAAPSMIEAKAAADTLDAVHKGTDGAKDVLHLAMWLYDDGKETDALAKFRPLAEGGNRLAAYYTGKINYSRYDETDGSDDTLQETAMNWYRKAAEAGFVWAMLDLAQIHQERSWGTGGDDETEVAQSLRWYKAAMAEGSKAGFEGAIMMGAADSDLPQIPEFTASSPPVDVTPPASPQTFESPFPPVARLAAPVPPQQPAATPGLAPDGRSELQICGRIWGEWQWHTGDIPGVLTFDMQNRVGAAQTKGGPHVLTGTWTCDFQTSKFTITWQNGVIENLTMAADGSSVSGTNNFGSPISGTPLRAAR